MNGTYLKEPKPFRIFQGRNVNFYAHFHEQIELVFCLQGTSHVMIEGQQYALEPGDVAMVFPNQHHRYQHKKENGESRVCLVICYPSHVEDYYTEFTSMLPISPVIKREELPEFLPKLLDNFHQVCNESEDLRMFKAYASVLTAHLLNCAKLQPIKASQHVDLTQTVLAYINQHYREAVSLKKMSKELGISESTLSRIFSNKLKINFTSYVNEQRIAYAQKLLKSTEYTMKEISALCGFQSERTFYRAFQEVWDMSPKEYRRQKRDKLI